MYAFSSKPVLIRPINPAVFRWGGEYSPILTGPMNKGSSEPFPLPSTIAGFLYWISQGANVETKTRDVTQSEGNPDINEDYKTISKVEIFGPFFYAKGTDEMGNDKICLSIHQYPKKLSVINEECKTKEKTFDPVYVSKIGIGHEIAKKQAHTDKGLIYTVEYVDYYATAVESLGLKEVKEYGILVYTNAKVEQGFYPFGSEGRVVEVKEGEDEIKEVKIFDSNVYILSPIILKANESPSPLIISPDANNLVVDENNGKKITVSDLALSTIRLSLIGLGFNVKYNIKRPIYLAIMPGEIEAKDEKEKFNALLNKLDQKPSKFLKLGLFDKIWGSMLIGGGYNG